MPFPLAHPAAVLPLRRFCPRRLDFPALVIGSMVPDLGYAIDPVRTAAFSHRLIAGAFGFGLPIGFGIWLIFDALREPFVASLPLRYRTLFPARNQRPPGWPWIVVISLLLGDWTHWLLDSLAHWNGWFVQHLPPLRRLVFHVGHSYFFACDCLYYLFTLVGTFYVVDCYLNWLQKRTGSPTLRAAGARWTCGVLLAMATVVAAYDCRYAPSFFSVVVAGMITLLILLCFVAGTLVCFNAATPPIRVRPLPAKKSDPAGRVGQ